MRSVLPILAMIVVGAAACDAVFTSAPDDADVFDAPIPGLTNEEMADVLDIATSTVKRDWAAAKKFLAAELADV